MAVEGGAEVVVVVVGMEGRLDEALKHLFVGSNNLWRENLGSFTYGRNSTIDLQARGAR